MARRLITTLTPSTPTASYTYTGTGAGKVDFVVEIEDDNGSVVSEPYNVWDCVKYDTGIDGTATDIYDTRNANSLLTRTSEYSKLTEVNTGTTATLYISNIDLDCVVDFEMMQVDGTIYNQNFGVYSSTTWKTNFTLSNIGGTVGEWIKVRMSFAEGSATLTNLEDITKTTTKTFTGTPNRMLWLTSDVTTEIRIRNVKVYPL